jgi:hypothetical protein
LVPLRIRMEAISVTPAPFAALVGSFEVEKSLRYDNRANFTPARGVFQEID